ncbi:MAG: uroporphyrinogen decarboxylase, partial [Candidatus Hydrogenedentes bacterium]|nr:uroporphyrinogen decarboxylase [Candidatus Hydrogenedentota bacterium]
MHSPFSVSVTPDWEGLVRSIMRDGSPSRVHYIELFLDGEVQEAIAGEFGVLDGLDRADPYFEQKKQVALQSFLGYDFIRCGIERLDMPLRYEQTADTAALARNGGRSYIDEHRGPITNWDEFEAYPWPDVKDIS